jgi:hypothetical protein
MASDASTHIEQKYLFPAGKEELILDWLEHACLPDPEYDGGLVSTIYYDTSSFALYYSKRNGDFLKCKVRLRWYGEVDVMDRESEVKCFLEIKRKQGAARWKHRREVPLAPGNLTVDPWSDEEIMDLPYRVFDMHYLPPGILLPMILIRYQRRRYVEVGGSCRIAADTAICCTQANERFLPALPPVHLWVGVLEIKGINRSMPEGLKGITPHLTKSPFSKYAHCLENLMQPAGRNI